MTAKPSRAQERLNKLEKEIKGRGVRLAYERLQFAGLRLKSGLCWFKGQYFLFVDRYKTVPERIDLIDSALQELDELAAQNALGDPTALAESAEPAAKPSEEATPGEDAPDAPAAMAAGADVVAEVAADAPVDPDPEKPA